METPFLFVSNGNKKKHDILKYILWSINVAVRMKESVYRSKNI